MTAATTVRLREVRLPTCEPDEERQRIALEVFQHLENVLLDRILIGDGCWEWQGRIDDGGYGAMPTGERAHRLSYLVFKGAILEGRVIDHLCRNTKCVRPNHLEAVTIRENVLRGEGAPAKNAKKTHCKRGHPLSGDNLYDYYGDRQCKACHRERSRAYNKTRPLEPRSTLPRSEWPSRNPALAERLREGYRQGRRPADMARETGLTRGGIRHFLKREGLH